MGHADCREAAARLLEACAYLHNRSHREALDRTYAAVAIAAVLVGRQHQRAVLDLNIAITRRLVEPVGPRRVARGAELPNLGVGNLTAVEALEEYHAILSLAALTGGRTATAAGLLLLRRLFIGREDNLIGGFAAIVRNHRNLRFLPVAHKLIGVGPDGRGLRAERVLDTRNRGQIRNRTYLGRIGILVDNGIVRCRTYLHRERYQRIAVLRLEVREVDIRKVVILRARDIQHQRCKCQKQYFFHLVVLLIS